MVFLVRLFETLDSMHMCVILLRLRMSHAPLTSPLDLPLCMHEWMDGCDMDGWMDG